MKPLFFNYSSLLLILHSASALSCSSSPLQGFHSTNSASTTRVTNADLRQRSTKPPIKPYIPDGLTEEQYRTIKHNELAQKRSMNFAAWGPRFKRMTADSDNNWFNLPSLWTNGYTAHNHTITPNNNNSLQQKNIMVAIGITLFRYLRRYGIAYLFILLSTQLLLLSRIPSAKQIVLPISLSSSKKLSIVVRLLLPFVILKPMIVLFTMLVTKLPRIGLLNKDGATK